MAIHIYAIPVSVNKTKLVKHFVQLQKNWKKKNDIDHLCGIPKYVVKIA